MWTAPVTGKKERPEGETLFSFFDCHLPFRLLPSQKKLEQVAARPRALDSGASPGPISTMTPLPYSVSQMRARPSDVFPPAESRQAGFRRPTAPGPDWAGSRQGVADCRRSCGHQPLPMGPRLTGATLDVCRLRTFPSDSLGWRSS